MSEIGALLEPADRREDFIRRFRRARVDQDHAIWSDLHDDVAARAGDDVKVRAYLNQIELVARLLGGRRMFPSTEQKRRDRKNANRR